MNLLASADFGGKTSSCCVLVFTKNASKTFLKHDSCGGHLVTVFLRDTKILLYILDSWLGSYLLIDFACYIMRDEICMPGMFVALLTITRRLLGIDSACTS